jgi:hypothetical protein
MSLVTGFVAFAVGVFVGHKFYTPFMAGVKAIWAKVISWFSKAPVAPVTPAVVSKVLKDNNDPPPSTGSSGEGNTEKIK